MAKMLSKVWKTETGQFFETKEEALTHERKAKIGKALSEAWEESTAKAHKTGGSALNPFGGAGQQMISDRYSKPSGFFDALIAKLDEAGLLRELDE